MTNLIQSFDTINKFKRGNLKKRLSQLDAGFVGKKLSEMGELSSLEGIGETLIRSAITVKRASARIDEVVHAVGILILLPLILRKSETIESLSLGAGNTGKNFDLVTNHRIAEFKFIEWKGGAEAIRQNSLFKDFYYLAECDTSRKRYLYVLGTKYPLLFFNGDRAISSVLSKNNKLTKEFGAQFGDRFQTVSQYYNFRKSLVKIVDINEKTAYFSGNTE